MSNDILISTFDRYLEKNKYFENTLNLLIELYKMLNILKIALLEINPVDQITLTVYEHGLISNHGLIMLPCFSLIEIRIDFPD